MTKLRALIDREPVTAEEHEPLATVAQRMFQEEIGSVCVLDATGQLVGICTERDVVRACGAGVDTHAATVGRWMTRDPHTADANDHAAAALQVMIDRGFRHLPVVGEGGLAGVVSIRDLTREVQAARMG